MNQSKLKIVDVGEVFVSREPQVAKLNLGSEVAVCVYSETLKVGGIVCFEFPNKQLAVPGSKPLLIAQEAVSQLFVHLHVIAPGQSQSLKAKIVGGAIIAGKETLARDNVACARKMLEELGVPVVGSDVGGQMARELLFYTDSGRLRVAQSHNQPSMTPKVRSALPVQKAPARTRVFIIDDSKSMRELLAKMLASDPQIEVVGSAENPVDGELALSQARPDVITLDLNMPKMDGLTFLKQKLPKLQLPVVVVSAVGIEEGRQVVDALELGAVDYLQKPTMSELKEMTGVICEKVKSAATIDVRSMFNRKRQSVTKDTYASEVLNKQTLIAIGASTGGTEALRELFSTFPNSIPPVVVVQHIPPFFSKAFADRLNQLCPFEVKEAEDGDAVEPNRVLIAPGGKQMKLANAGTKLVVRISDDPPVNRHKPSVDYLFDSVAQICGRKSIGVVLTGMGADGAGGLLKMRQAGAHTVVQDEKSCVVFGMPREAIEIGAAERVCALNDISGVLVNWLRLPGKMAS